MIEVQHLTYRRGKKGIIDDVSFKIRNGHIYGLVGPADAGKSTVMNLMAGCLKPTEGAVLINGYDMAKNPMEAKRQIGYLPQHAPMMADMTPQEYLTFIAEIKGVRDEQLSRQVRDALALADLTAVQHVLIGNLSDGVRRRIGIVQSMLGNPDILLLDEPAEGLDASQTRDIRVLIRALGEKLTVVVAASRQADLGGMCDHVIVLEEGQVVADEEVEATPFDPLDELDAEMPEAALAEDPIRGEAAVADAVFEDDVPDDSTDEEVTD